MKNKIKEPIRKYNHCLPQPYLRGFCDENNRIYTYNKHLKKYSQATPKNTAGQNYLYCKKSSTVKGEIDHLEKWFEKVEDKSKNIFSKLRDKNQFPSNKEEREILSLYFTTLVMRSPIQINYWSAQRYIDKALSPLILNIAENKGIFEVNLQKVLTTEILNKDKSLDKTRLFAIDFLVPFFYNIRWALIETYSEYPFITGDNIFSLLNQEPRFPAILQNGLPIKDDLLFIPISSTLTLRMINDNEFRDGDFIGYNKEYTRCLNYLIFTKSNFVFAKSQSIINELFNTNWRTEEAKIKT